jgi:arsenate reductase (thioredoxin)
MQITGRKMNILYLCTGNSCRSQMAEAYTNALKGDVFQAYSAGVKAQDRIDPLALNVLKEDPDINDKVELSTLRPKTLDDLQGIHFDYVVTVCDNAAEGCPIFPGQTQRIHRSFTDPPRLVKEGGLTGDAALKVYRDIRNQIKAFVQSLPQGLKQPQGVGS